MRQPFKTNYASGPHTIDGSVLNDIGRSINSHDLSGPGAGDGEIGVSGSIKGAAKYLRDKFVARVVTRITAGSNDANGDRVCGAGTITPMRGQYDRDADTLTLKAVQARGDDLVLPCYNFTLEASGDAGTFVVVMRGDLDERYYLINEPC